MAAYMMFVCCDVCQRHISVVLPQIGRTIHRIGCSVHNIGPTAYDIGRTLRSVTSTKPLSSFILHPAIRKFSSSSSLSGKDFRSLTTKTPQLAAADTKPKELREGIDEKLSKENIANKESNHINKHFKNNGIGYSHELTECRALYRIHIPGQSSQPIKKKRDESLSDQLVAQVVPCPIEPEDGNKEKNEEPPEWVENKVQLKELPSLYMQLSKSRLTGLVVLSAMAGYGMSSGDFIPATFALMSLGTFLTSCSANAMNQFFEVPFDSQMLRTRNRVLVRGLLSSTHSVGFASISGITGVSILGLFVNPLSAAIAFSTWALYTMAYTPLKRVSIINTWVGAVVGALPPLIGWTACSGNLEAGALVLAGVLYAWQFPHFNALSWNLRKDYSRGGYRMMATTDPGLCRRVAVRHCVGITALCTLAPVIDLTTWAFALDTLPINLWFTWLSWRFYQRADSQSAKQLFRFSLLHLPIVMLLMIISKKKLSQTESKRNILALWTVQVEKDI